MQSPMNHSATLSAQESTVNPYMANIAKAMTWLSELFDEVAQVRREAAIRMR